MLADGLGGIAANRQRNIELGRICDKKLLPALAARLVVQPQLAYLLQSQGINHTCGVAASTVGREILTSLCIEQCFGHYAAS